MINLTVSAIAGMIGGALTWLLTNFVGNPVMRFYKVRDEVHSALTIFANVSPVYEQTDPRAHPDWNRFVEAQTTFRRHAAELGALAVNYRTINRFLMWLGYDPGAAASGLIGYSNSIADPAARRRGELAWHRDHVERSMKFPLTYPDGIKVRD